jgi:phospholipase/carboxylesterase
VIPVTINNGTRMRAWYDIVGFDLVSREDERGLRASLAAVQGLIDREAERGTPSERIVLAGFSQGCAMALLTGIRCPQRLAGIAGLSGYLPLASLAAAERSPANTATPIFLAHGRFDNVVQVERGKASRDVLQAIGHSVEWHEYPIAHSVSMDEITDLNRWLERVLAPV